MGTHTSVLVWKIPWTEEPGGLQSMRSQESNTTKPLSRRTHTHTHTLLKTCDEIKIILLKIMTVQSYTKNERFLFYPPILNRSYVRSYL